MKYRIFIVIVVSILTTFAFSPTTQAQDPVTPPTTLSAVSGQTVWIDNCAPCHGVSGKGDGPTASALEFTPVDFTDATAAKNRSLAYMFGVVKDGRMEKMMPPWKDRLNDSQIWDVVAYAASFGTSDTDIIAGEAIYTRSCVECHGENGDGADGKYNFSNAADLIDFSPQNLFNELRTPEGKHPQTLDNLSDDEIWQSLAYVQTLSVVLPVPVASDGVYRGQVLNVTTGEPLPDAPITLYVLNADGSVIDTVEDLSDENGAFEFTDLKRDVTFGLGTEYLGVQYFTDKPLSFSSDSAEIEQTLLVYETTDSAENISQSTLHRIVAFVPGAINITDIYIFDNKGNTSYVGTLGSDGLPETAKVALPADATEVSFQGDTTRQTDDGYYTESRPIPPGEGKYSFVVSYFIPVDGKSIEVGTPLIHDVATVNLLLADQGADFSSDQLQMTSEQDIQGLNYQRWTGTSFIAGQNLTMSFSKLNKLDFGQEDGTASATGFAVSGPDQNIVRWGILGVGALVIAFVLWMVYGPVTAISTATAVQKEQLLAILQELDIMHQAGDLDDAEYQRLKEKNTTALKAILLKNNDKS